MEGKDLIEYTEKIYFWAINKTHNRYEAEELSQQIMLEALSSIDNIQNEKAFHGWLWSLAKNVYKQWLYAEQRHNYYNISISEINAYSDKQLDFELLHKEDIDEILKEISKLSAKWRDILIFYYFDGKTIAQISRDIGLTEGTIKWRLHEAREKVKKGMENMEVKNSSIIKPIKLNVSTMGMAFDVKPDMHKPLPPFPDSYIQNAVAQNIAAAAYCKSATIEEISSLTGIPAYYIEEEMQKLVENELMLKKGIRYSTNFVIIKNSSIREIHSILNNYGTALSKKIIDSINSAESEIRSINFGGCSRNFNDLMWTLIPFAFRECNSSISYNFTEMLPKRNNGGRWYIYAFEKSMFHYLYIGQALCPDESESYFHNMYSWDSKVVNISSKFGSRRFIGREYINILTKLFDGPISVSEINDNEKEMTAELIKRGEIIRNGSELSLNIISMTNAQYCMLKEVMSKVLNSFSRELSEVSEKISNILSLHSLKHLSPQIDFMTKHISSELGTYIIKTAFEQGLLHEPDEPKTAGIFIYKRK